MYQISLLDKLTLEHLDRGRRSVEQVKESVARDVEHLLNTRRGTIDDLKAYPHLTQSVACYGLQDFASMTLSSQGDRDRICEDIRQSLLRHEPRLRNPDVTLVAGEGKGQRLHFSIRAVLLVHDEQERVSFDAVLQPVSLNYRVDKSARP